MARKLILNFPWGCIADPTSEVSVTGLEKSLHRKVQAGVLKAGPEGNFLIYKKR